MKECYIRFRASVNTISTQSLFKIVDEKYRQQYSIIHILLSTVGGSVKDGVDIYNYLNALPIEVYTYNVGQVDSIGVVVYSSGKKRFSVPNARFLIHPVGFNSIANERYDEHLLKERQNSLKTDQENISEIISTTVKKDKQEVLSKIHERTTFSSKEAEEYGLVESIVKGCIVPEGVEIFSIEDQIQLNNPPIQFQRMMSTNNPEITAHIHQNDSTMAVNQYNT